MCVRNITWAEVAVGEHIKIGEYLLYKLNDGPTNNAAVEDYLGNRAWAEDSVKLTSLTWAEVARHKMVAIGDYEFRKINDDPTNNAYVFDQSKMMPTQVPPVSID